MSTNLNIRNKQGHRCHIWQTPTQITQMIMTDEEGNVNEYFTGKRALFAIRQYIQWVKGSVNRGYVSTEDMKMYEEDVAEEVRNVESWLKHQSTRDLVVEGW